MIRNLPVRYPEIGRLRLGDFEGKTKGGKQTMRQLNTWRATAHDEHTLKAFAAVYGGEVVPWPKGEGGDQYQVIADLAELDVLLPPEPLFSAYERWGSGGCQRRCDGEFCDEVATGPDGGTLVQVNCPCEEKGWMPGEPDDVRAGACTPVVRLKVILPNLPGMGIWMMTTNSINAAMELPGQIQLMQAFLDRGIQVPARLVIERRKIKKAWEQFAREFNVPVLRIDTSMDKLKDALLTAPRNPGALAGPQRALAPAPVQGDTALDVPDAPENPAPALEAPPEGLSYGADLTSDHILELQAALDPASAKAFMGWRRRAKIGTKPDDWTPDELAKMLEFLTNG